MWVIMNSYWVIEGINDMAFRSYDDAYEFDNKLNPDKHLIRLCPLNVLKMYYQRWIGMNLIKDNNNF